MSKGKWLKYLKITEPLLSDKEKIPSASGKKILEIKFRKSKSAELFSSLLMRRGIEKEQIEQTAKGQIFLTGRVNISGELDEASTQRFQIALDLLCQKRPKLKNRVKKFENNIFKPV